MKLSPSQIEYIEHTLVKNDLNFDDLKFELIDHIASEIEMKMAIDEMSFTTAFYSVFDNWKEQLRPSQNTVFLGRNLVAPKIVIDRLSFLKKRELLTGFGFCFIVTLLFYGMNTTNIFRSFLQNIEPIIQKVFLLTSILLTIFKIILYKSELRTTYSVLFNKSFFLAIPFCVIISLGGFSFFRTESIDNLRMSAVSATIFYGFFLFSSLRFLYQHYQFVKKIKRV
jgi:hypothetical protein